jgi:hypothetical protein
VGVLNALVARDPAGVVSGECWTCLQPCSGLPPRQTVALWLTELTGRAAGDSCVERLGGGGSAVENAHAAPVDAAAATQQSAGDSEYSRANEWLHSKWLESAQLGGHVVTRGQTRTPPALVDLVFSVLGEEAPWQRLTRESQCVLCGPGWISWALPVMDLGAGSGVLVSAALRAALKSLEHDALAPPPPPQPLAPATSAATLPACRVGLALQAQLLQRALSSLAHALCAVDIDTFSCAITRVRLLALFRPSVARAHALASAAARAPSARCTAPDCACTTRGWSDDAGDGTRLLAAVTCWRLPRLNVCEGSAPLLYRRCGRGTQTEAGLPDALAEASLGELERLVGRRFSLLLLNPPYRNLARDAAQGGSGAAFLSAAPQWARFRHHNLYGYFLETAIDLLAPGGTLAAVTLRNVVDSGKYPGDAGFHASLVRRCCIQRIVFLDGDAFVGEPYDHVKDSHISAALLVLRRPGQPVGACVPPRLSEREQALPGSALAAAYAEALPPATPFQSVPAAASGGEPPAEEACDHDLRHEHSFVVDYYRRIGGCWAPASAWPPPPAASYVCACGRDSAAAASALSFVCACGSETGPAAAARRCAQILQQDAPRDAPYLPERFDQHEVACALRTAPLALRALDRALRSNPRSPLPPCPALLTYGIDGVPA